MTSENAMSPADIAALTKNNGDMFGGGNGAWWIIILFLFAFCGWGGGNWGGGTGGVSENYALISDNATLVMLFGRATADDLRSLDEKTFLDVFDGVPTFELEKAKLPLNILDALAVETSIFPSKGEARKMIQGNGFSVNKEKRTDPNSALTEADIIDGKYILAQKGKKDYYIIIVK